MVCADRSFCPSPLSLFGLHSALALGALGALGALCLLGGLLVLIPIAVIVRLHIRYIPSKHCSRQMSDMHKHTSLALPTATAFATLFGFAANLLDHSIERIFGIARKVSVLNTDLRRDTLPLYSLVERSASFAIL